ncbi:hypothetical protein DFH06DRAFT_1292010 [Mycena polygramma]|nr:hypothetical protein DFH06DRAFT_1292010 [Mycena polygramma]
MRVLGWWISARTAVGGAVSGLAEPCYEYLQSAFAFASNAYALTCADFPPNRPCFVTRLGLRPAPPTNDEEERPVPPVVDRQKKGLGAYGHVTRGALGRRIICEGFWNRKKGGSEGE